MCGPGSAKRDHRHHRLHPRNVSPWGRLASTLNPPPRRATAHAARFLPGIPRLGEPIDRAFWKRYDFIEAMPLNQALNYPVCGEA
jgi:hypothetical protein